MVDGYVFGLVESWGRVVSKSDEIEGVTPYQARLYNAVLYGVEQATKKTRKPARRAVRALWDSRRALQAENARLRARIELIEDLAIDAQRSTGERAAVVGADWVLYASGRTWRPPNGFKTWLDSRKAE